jgi:LPPG:FO 2-phospho-L-lactate transferase
MRDDIVNRDDTLSNIDEISTKVTILSGGVGGARFARGFEGLPGVNTTVIVNVGDDATTHGLPVSPDLDTVLYTLAGLEGPQGWGRASDTFTANDELARFGIDNTFRLGDRDLALKIARLASFGGGESLSAFARRVAGRLGIRSTVLPATDDRVETEIRLGSGEWVPFQEYFVTRGHRDTVSEIRFQGDDLASPAPGVIDSIEAAEVLIIGPSNPPLSIWPILAIPGIRDSVTAHHRTLAVSPLIGGKAVKGPVVEVMAALGFPPGNTGVLAAYSGLIDKLFVDESDFDPATVAVDGVEIVPGRTLIVEPDAARDLASTMMGL